MKQSFLLPRRIFLKILFVIIKWIVFFQLICASNNTTPFRFDEYGGLVTVMKNSENTNEMNVNQTTINDPTSSTSITHSTTDFLLPQ
jgi:hypothetical protein